MIKELYFLILPIFMVSACSSFNGTEISGKISGAENMTAYLDEMRITSQPQMLLQYKIESDGKFNFAIPDGIKKGIYRIRVGEQFVDLIMDGTEKNVVVEGDLFGLNDYNYTVTGSPLSEKFLK